MSSAASGAPDGVAPFDRAAIPPLVDAVAASFAAPPWDREIARAREEFDRQRGRVFDDEELFADHMAAFLERYTLERPLPDGQPPVIVELARSGQTDPLLLALARSQRGLFELLDLVPRGLLLADLIGGGRWRVERDAPRDGLKPGEIFEGRLIPWAGRVELGPVTCWHPREAAGWIHQIVRQAAESGRLGPRLIDELSMMRLKHSRFRNIAISRIYETHDPPAGCSGAVESRPGGV